MVATEQIAPTEQRDAQAAYAAAKAQVRQLEAEIAALPARYKEALRAGDAGGMAAVRMAKFDAEERLLVARVLAVRAEIATIQQELDALGPGEAAALRAVMETGAAVQRAKDALNAALAASDAAQAATASNRGHREILANARWDLQQTLKQLTSAAMPE